MSSRFIRRSSSKLLHDGSKHLLRSVGSFSSSDPAPGKVWNLVKADADSYADLIVLEQSSPSLVRKIFYCQQKLDLNSRSSSDPRNCIERTKSFINHDLIIVVMVIGKKEHFFVAEKTGTGEKVGIHINSVSNMDEYDESVLRTFDCKDTPITVRELMTLLEDHESSYTLHDENCWKYAVDITAKLLWMCHKKTNDPYFEDAAQNVCTKVTMRHVKGMAKMISRMAYIEDAAQNVCTKSYLEDAAQNVCTKVTMRHVKGMAEMISTKLSLLVLVLVVLVSLSLVMVYTVHSPVENVVGGS